MPVPFDKHTIDTPEQLQLDFAVAGIGSRFLALALDSLIQLGIVLGVAFVVWMAVLAIGIRNIGTIGGLWLFAILLLALFTITYGYFALFEIFWHGQTPGKRAVSIRVVKDSGRPLSVPETIGRNLLRIVDQLPGFYAIGIVCALTNSRSQRLGDLIVGSLVVRESRASGSMPSWDSNATTGIASEGTISLDDLRLIESFLSRRDELNGDVRQRMAATVFAKVKPAGTVVPEGMSNEAALEQLVRARRAG